MKRKIRTLLFSTLYPSSVRPGHGIFVETLESGDTVSYKYQMTSTTKDKIVQAASDTWTITGGTGKLKGIKGSGTCKGKGDAAGALSLDCMGKYTMAMAK